MSELPYFYTVSNISKYFNKIHDAETPEKFDSTFLKEVLGFRSGNDQKLITVLKDMEFLDPSGIPLKRYKDFRAESFPSKSLGEGIKTAYQQLFSRNVNANLAPVDEIKGYVVSITGKSSDNTVVRLINSSYNELKKLADFKKTEEKGLTDQEKKNLPAKYEPTSKELDMKLSYTIVLNLPATTTKEVYDTLFASLKENLLKN